jgi:hypothetical protein
MPPLRESVLLAENRTGKLYPLNMRTTFELRKRLEEEASQSGRSLASEVEYRLERSFDQEAVIDALRERLFRRS